MQSGRFSAVSGDRADAISVGLTGLWLSAAAPRTWNASPMPTWERPGRCSRGHPFGPIGSGTQERLPGHADTYPQSRRKLRIRAQDRSTTVLCKNVVRQHGIVLRLLTVWKSRIRAGAGDPRCCGICEQAHPQLSWDAQCDRSIRTSALKAPSPVDTPRPAPCQVPPPLAGKCLLLHGPYLVHMWLNLHRGQHRSVDLKTVGVYGSGGRETR